MATEGRTMNTLIVYESLFGNTRLIAETIAQTLRASGDEVTEASAAEAPADVTGFDLVVIGAPTHAHSLPRPSSRTEGAKWADDPHKDLTLEPGALQSGVREWLQDVTFSEPKPRFAAYSTRADTPRIFAGDASAAIGRLLGKLDARIATHEAFLVDSGSRLLPGEQQRAREWALTLLPVRSDRG
jgi:hypothetical protein